MRPPSSSRGEPHRRSGPARSRRYTLCVTATSRGDHAGHDAARGPPGRQRSASTPIAVGSRFPTVVNHAVSQQSRGRRAFPRPPGAAAPADPWCLAPLDRATSPSTSPSPDRGGNRAVVTLPRRCPPGRPKGRCWPCRRAAPMQQSGFPSCLTIGPRGLLPTVPGCSEMSGSSATATTSTSGGSTRPTVVGPPRRRALRGATAPSSPVTTDPWSVSVLIRGAPIGLVPRDVRSADRDLFGVEGDVPGVVAADSVE